LSDNDFSSIVKKRYLFYFYASQKLSDGFLQADKSDEDFAELEKLLKPKNVIFSNMDKITEKQENYIQILSGYEYSKREDEKDIDDYLKEHDKKSISQLSKTEASELIKTLLQRPTEYTFACGKKAILHKQEVNCYLVMGELEACLHACPDGIDVNDCSYLDKLNNV